jgi:hypothetical protein
MNDIERLDHLLWLLLEGGRPERLAGVLGDTLSDPLGDLVSVEAARAAILRRSGPGLRSFSAAMQRAVARRVLLGRREDLLRAFVPFWETNGTPRAVVDKAVEAAVSAGAWPAPLVDLRSATRWEIPFSPAYARFAASLGGVEAGDRVGPLGQAVRCSRYHGDSRRDATRPFLSGETRLPAGFPVVLGRPGTALALFPLPESAWVEPVARWPEWLDVPAADLPPAVAAQQARARDLRSRWTGLLAGVEHALAAAGYRCAAPQVVPPEWLVLFVAVWGVEDVESAGLSLALHALAAGGWPLPAGLGFTGAWAADGTIRPVAHLREKLAAARDGGIFALVACASEAEVTELEQERSERSVALILLEEGLDIRAIARQVNSACALLGLTEERWACASGHQREQCRVAQPGRRHSRPLPEAADASALPVGFLGRADELRQLTAWKAESHPSPRRLGVLEGAMRAGKTTLLARWLQDEQAWPLYPVWFSCVRGHPRASRLEHVRAGLEAQILARFRLLPLPVSDSPGTAPADTSGWPEAILRTCDATAAPINVVLDGLDEARHDDQEQILELVRSLPGGGVSVVGGQVGTPALGRPQEALRIQLQADHEAACRLVQAFGELLQGDPATQAFGTMVVTEPGRRSRLAERAGDNLWILTEFLQAVLERTASAPSSPDDLPVRETVATYVRLVREEILDTSPPPERALLWDMLQTLALLDISDQAWAPTDLARFASSAWTAGSVHAAAVGELRRLLIWTNGGVRFRDETFRDITAADALTQDRGRGRSLAVALIDVLAGREAPSPFQSAFATVYAAQFVLEHATVDAALASRLLATPWAGSRYHQLTIDGSPLRPLLEELHGLLRVAPAQTNAPASELFGAISHWRPAIESGVVPPGQWWPLLGPVRDGLTQGESSLPEANQDGPVLLAPPDGYRAPSPQSLDLNGVGCAVEVGDRERVALASPDGRVFVFTRDGTGFRQERVLAAERGEVRRLEPLGGWLVLMGLRQPTEWQGTSAVSSLCLVDLDAPLPPVPIDSPSGLVSVAALGAAEGCARIVVTTKDGDAEELRLYHFSYLQRAAGTPLTLEPEGRPVSLPSHAWRLLAFAQDTWAVCFSLGNRASSGDSVLVYRAIPEGIQVVTSPELTAALQGYKVNDLCPVHGGRLAVVITPCRPGDGVEGVYLLVVGEDGRLLHRIRLDSTFLPEEPREGRHARRVSALRWAQLHDNEALFDMEPLGCHAHFGLLLSRSGEVYRAIDLESEALPRHLPEAIEKRISVPSEAGISLRGSVQLTRGRIVLVFSSFAVLLGADSSTVATLRGGSHIDIFRLLGTTRSGAVALCSESWFDNQCSRSEHRYLTFPLPAPAGTPVEEGFLNVGPTGMSVSRSGLQLFVSDGPGEPRPLWDATELRGVLDGGEPLDIDNALCLDERNWACSLFARQPTPEVSEQEGGFGGRRERTDLLLVGCTGDTPVYLPIADVPREWDCRIESLANGLVGFRYGYVDYDNSWGQHPLHLYDLVADDLACPHPERQIGAHEIAYQPPLLGVSPEWVLLLGPRRGRWKYGDDEVYAGYQYRVGSLEEPSPVKGLSLTRRLAVVDRSHGRADLSELRQADGRTWVRLLRLGIDAAFGIRLQADQASPVDLGRGVADAVDVGHLLLAVAYESPPFRIELLRLPATAAGAPAAVAVGYLAEPPRQVMLAGGPALVSLAISTDSGVTWFDLTGVPGVGVGE